MLLNDPPIKSTSVLLPETKYVSIGTVLDYVIKIPIETRLTENMYCK
jgi:hypothetical protein